MATHIKSSAQWRQVTGDHSIVVTDFYADWCGPCKMIAPTFESLANKHAKPGRIAFCKVDVDNQRDIAQQYRVSAMPTFLVLRNGSVIDTIQGANPPALTAAVEKAVKLAGPGTGASFSTPGRTLGTDAPPATEPTVRIGGGATRASGNPIRGSSSLWNLNNLVNAVLVFFGLYFTSLFSMDPYMAAQNSRFNTRNHATAPINTGAPFGGRAFGKTASSAASGSSSGSATARAAATKRTAPSKFKTLADL